MTLDNTTIGRNIAKLRKLKDIKAADIATQLGLKEASYTKYERGETAITVDFLKKVAEVLDVAPINLVSLPMDFIFQYLQKNPVGTAGSSQQLNKEFRDEDIAKILASIAELNKSVLTIIGKE